MVIDQHSKGHFTSAWTEMGDNIESTSSNWPYGPGDNFYLDEDLSLLCYVMSYYVTGQLAPFFHTLSKTLGLKMLCIKSWSFCWGLYVLSRYLQFFLVILVQRTMFQRNKNMEPFRMCLIGGSIHNWMFCYIIPLKLFNSVLIAFTQM